MHYPIHFLGSDVQAAFIECAKFYGLHAIMGLRSLVSSCLMNISFVGINEFKSFSWLQNYSCGYFMSLKVFHVSILWVKFFILWLILWFKYFPHFSQQLYQKWNSLTSISEVPLLSISKGPLNMYSKEYLPVSA